MKAFTTLAVLGLFFSANLAVGLHNPATAQPQPKCMPSDAVPDWMRQHHGEMPNGTGVEARGGMVEHFLDPEDGSWSMVVHTPSGMSCIVGWGDNWRSVEQVSLLPEA